MGTIYPEYMKTSAVAKACGVSRVTVLRWLVNGTLRGFRLPNGGPYRIPSADFLDFAKKNNIPVEQ